MGAAIPDSGIPARAAVPRVRESLTKSALDAIPDWIPGPDPLAARSSDWILTGREIGLPPPLPGRPFPNEGHCIPGRTRAGILTVAPSQGLLRQGPLVGSTNTSHLIGGGCFLRPNLQRLNQIIGTAVPRRRPPPASRPNVSGTEPQFSAARAWGHEPAIPVPIAYQMEQENGAIPAVTIRPSSERASRARAGNSR